MISIVGMGISGISVLKFLLKKNNPEKIFFFDTRLSPPDLKEFKHTFPLVNLKLGSVDASILLKSDEIILSPGVSRALPAIHHAIMAGKSVIGDIELFAREANAPIIAITGTNAKSTVTTWVGEMAKTAGLKVAIGGNLGTPALDLLNFSGVDVFVLELSSFQLESTHSLKPEVACVLNVTPDHLDRYVNFAEYAKTKRRIFFQAKKTISFLQDKETYPEGFPPTFYFSDEEPFHENIFGLIHNARHIFLARHEKVLLNVNELALKGKHNYLNALAALAIGEAFGFPMKAMLETLKKFPGLPHRCQWVRKYAGVEWFNDSKGTNVGATIAAIDGLTTHFSGNMILIAGGVGKGADFSELIDCIQQKIKAVILMGEAANELSHLLTKKVSFQFADSMERAVQLAAELAQSGDRVLLSPACASLDMFKNFMHRGDVFMKCVDDLGH